MSSAVVDRTLSRFQTERGNGRRFHKETIGDVDPDRCFGDWLCQVKTAWHPESQKRLEKVYGTVTKAAMAEVSGVTGGYTVPVDFTDTLFQFIDEWALVRPRAIVIPMASAETRVPLMDFATAQAAGTAPYFGGILLQWQTEAATRSESEPTWRQVNLHAWELSGYLLASNTLLNDAGKPLEDFLYRIFARSIAWYEDQAFLVGNGVGKPKGMLTSTAAISVTRNAGGDVKVVDCATMLTDLLPGSWLNACWTMHPNVFTKVFQLTAATGGAGFQSNQPREGPQAMQQVAGTIGPIPAYTSDKVPVLGTRGDLMLFDPSLYVIGDRRMVDIAVSDMAPTPFAANQSAWRVVHRVDGDTWLNAPVTLADGTQTASSVVVLN